MPSMVRTNNIPTGINLSAPFAKNRKKQPLLYRYGSRSSPAKIRGQQPETGVKLADHSLRDDHSSSLQGMMKQCLLLYPLKRISREPS